MNKIEKARKILNRRIREQGILTSLLWLYGRGLPAITGIPILKFSRVTDHLYVGPQFRANGLRYLEQHGIHAVVNMRIEVDDAARGIAARHYCYLPTIDDTAPSIDQLNSGVAFIRQMIETGEKVYIHCGAGVGRAPTMAAAYLVASGMSVNDALDAIRRVRPFIYIMPPQYTQLLQFADQVRGRA